MRVSVLVLATLRSEHSLQHNSVRPQRPLTEHKHTVRTTNLKGYCACAMDNKRQVFGLFLLSGVLILSVLSGLIYSGCLVSCKDQRQIFRSICMFLPAQFIPFLSWLLLLRKNRNAKKKTTSLNIRKPAIPVKQRSAANRRHKTGPINAAAVATETTVASLCTDPRENSV